MNGTKCQSEGDVSDSKISDIGLAHGCTICGHTWLHGHDGSHSCTERLTAENARLREEVEKTSNSWKCFHCGEVFTTKESAVSHFGESVVCAPICQIYGTTVREMEKTIREYQTEDTELHRQINHLKSEMAQAVMRAEEAGYSKGLKDYTNLENQLAQARKDGERLDWLCAGRNFEEFHSHMVVHNRPFKPFDGRQAIDSAQLWVEQQ